MIHGVISASIKPAMKKRGASPTTTYTANLRVFERYSSFSGPRRNLAFQAAYPSLIPTDPDKTNEGISIIPWGKIAARNIGRLGESCGPTSTPRVKPVNSMERKLGAANPNPESAVAKETNQLLRKIARPRTGVAALNCRKSGLPCPGWAPRLNKLLPTPL